MNTTKKQLNPLQLLPVPDPIDCGSEFDALMSAWAINAGELASSLAENTTTAVRIDIAADGGDVTGYSTHTPTYVTAPIEPPLDWRIETLEMHCASPLACTPSHDYRNIADIVRDPLYTGEDLITILRRLNDDAVTPLQQSSSGDYRTMVDILRDPLYYGNDLITTLRDQSREIALLTNNNFTMETRVNLLESQLTTLMENM